MDAILMVKKFSLVLMNLKNYYLITITMMLPAQMQMMIPIQINVYGGTGNYTYLWLADNGFNSNDQDIYNLAGGNYALTITDENNCSSSEIIEITEDAGIVLSYIISDYNSYGVLAKMKQTDLLI